LLLDDELPALSYLKILCEEFPNVEVVKVFNDPSKFLDQIPFLDFNLCIIDIQMPNINGLEIANNFLLNDKLIIFTTAHKEFAAEAFDLNAVDYIRKPLQKERFAKAISKAIKLLRSNKFVVREHVVWNTNKGKTLLNFDDILYIKSSETDSRDKIVYLNNSDTIIIKNLSFDQILSILPKYNFCRINKKEIIALKTVLHFTSDEIKTSISQKNQTLTLSLSEVFKDEFKAKIQG